MKEKFGLCRRPHRRFTGEVVEKKLCYCSKIDLVEDIDEDLAGDVTGNLARELSRDLVAKDVLLQQNLTPSETLPESK
jgi:hypothetical protein